MANQSPDRRQVLDMLARVAVLAQTGLFSRWVFAGTPPGHEHEHHENASATAKPAGPYQPQYYSPEDYRTIAILTDLIIPEDDTPGAAQAGVSEFIDFMAAHDETELRKPMASGLAWLANTSQSQHGKPFTSLTPAEQTAILKSVAATASSDAAGHQFFVLIRKYTVMGYYTSRIGLEALDYPGLKLYTQSPACPHTGDPEHQHLPSARS